MRYLVDTNVVSELRKARRCDPGVAEWFEGLADEEVFLSVLTVGEIRRGIESIRRRDADAAASLDAWLTELARLHSRRILPVSREVAEEWGRLNVPDPLPVIDSLLAATARVHGMTLATRNTDDVAGTGVSLVDPFDLPS